MSLTASMWSSVSGLLNHGEKMNVIGNNIANVNTVAFKGSRMDFSDFMYSSVFGNNGLNQIGRGVGIGAIYGDFSQGAFESSNEATDLAISGNGFFKVIPKNGNDAYYTRAGNFRFDNQGYLVDPNGYVLQGWAIEQASSYMASSAMQQTNSSGYIVGTGTPVDIRLASYSCEPHHTQNVTLALNLDGNSTVHSTSTTDPFFSMFEHWDATPSATGEVQALGNDAYAYSQSIVVYDEGGGAHTLTVYFDLVDDTSDPSKQVWQYLVTMDPTEDMRTYWDGGTLSWEPIADDKKGLLMMGTMTFSSSGLMTDMMAYVPSDMTRVDDITTWVPAPISANGYPMFAANFTGQHGASVAWDDTLPLPTAAGPGDINPEAAGRLTELNMGFRTKDTWWDYGPTPTGPGTADLVGTNLTNLPGMGQFGSRQNPATTAYSGNGNNFYERYANQDGYTYGELSSISVTTNGILTGRYSNGVTLELFQITMYNFNAEHELYREGGNLFSQTRESGDPTQGAAGSGSFGTILGYNLEQSNVDIAREFVQMITTQRGFQSNSKLITTTDTMLENVINMKR